LEAEARNQRLERLEREIAQFRHHSDGGPSCRTPRIDDASPASAACLLGDAR
jgi:hypothetical protein